MEKKRVAISIIGMPNTGKSALAYAFQQFLTEHNIEATVTDLDEYPDPVTRAVTLLPLLADKVAVDIVVLQARRTANLDPLLVAEHMRKYRPMFADEHPDKFANLDPEFAASLEKGLLGISHA